MNNTTIIITVDGMEYPLDIQNLTGKEVGIIKRIGHVNGINAVPDALEAGDLELIAALAGIAIARTGANVIYDKLLDMPIGMINVKLPDDSESSDTPLAGTPETIGDQS